jgi:type IV pilus assembly protein PilO
MNLSEISWDLEYAGSWPTAVKACVIAMLSVVFGGLWYYLDTSSQLEQFTVAQGKEMELRSAFEQKQRKVANLDEYREQLLEIEKSFGDLLRQLPNKTEVPELLVDVSQTGLASGLEFELFKPGAESIKDFYAELPIEVKVVGTYSNFGGFVSGLASLPRIVTVQNIKIVPNDAKNTQAHKGDKFPLTMTALVRTYRYLDEGEVAAETLAKPTPAKKP